MRFGLLFAKKNTNLAANKPPNKFANKPPDRSARKLPDRVAIIKSTGLANKPPSRRLLISLPVSLLIRVVIGCVGLLHNLLIRLNKPSRRPDKPPNRQDRHPYRHLHKPDTSSVRKKVAITSHLSRHYSAQTVIPAHS